MYDRAKARFRRFKKGDATQVITHQGIYPGDRVLVFGRASSGPQEANGNAADQTKFLSNFVEEKSAIVVGTFEIQHSGWADLDDSCEFASRDWILDAVILAIQNEAKILAESTDRFVRHPHFHTEHGFDLQATDYDLQDLAMWTMGVSLHTYLHPNATHGEVRSHQTKRGKQAKGSHGGNSVNPKKPIDPLIQQKLDCKAVWNLYKSTPPPQGQKGRRNPRP